MPEELLEPNNNEPPTRIIGLAGRMGSGKDTSARFIAGMNLVHAGYIEEFKILDDGSFQSGDITNINDIAPDFCKIYHYADYLKEICHTLFGVPKHDLYNNKDALTKVTWSSLPYIMTDKSVFNTIKNFMKKKQEFNGDSYKNPFSFHEEGYLSVRELLQEVGTGIFRRMYADCWAEALIKIIQSESPHIALVADVRFINEIESLKSAGGVIVKMSRSINDSSHESEIDFLSYKGWDIIVDNSECKDVRCLNQTLYETLNPRGFFRL